jgi:hypothetical protein
MFDPEMSHRCFFIRVGLMVLIKSRHDLWIGDHQVIDDQVRLKRADQLPVIMNSPCE